MVIKFYPFTKFHNKKQTGSTTIRVLNLLAKWPEASLYRYGDDADVLILQKIYVGQDYKFITNFEGTKILDVCDPDWFDNAFIKETVEAVDAVVTPTQSMADFLSQMTDKPVRVIKDRFLVDTFPKPKKHTGDAKMAVWFGYKHNAELLRFAVPTLERLGYSLLVVANEDPMSYRYAGDSYKDRYTFIKYNQDTLYKTLQQADIAILPKGDRPQDTFKSENKTVIAKLCGLPVCASIEDLELYKSADNRNAFVDTEYANIGAEYDVQKSIDEYKRLINEIANQ